LDILKTKELVLRPIGNYNSTYLFVICDAKKTAKKRDKRAKSRFLAVFLAVFLARIWTDLKSMLETLHYEEMF
jgi:hypothetical protein